MNFLLQATLGASNGVLHLPLIKNKKTVNPRDSSTPAVFQLETAMGSAIECFDDAGAVVVPRARFAPVKTTNDLFGLRSDAFKVLALIFSLLRIAQHPDCSYMTNMACARARQSGNSTAVWLNHAKSFWKSGQQTTHCEYVQMVAATSTSTDH